jgi:hypothetical protein
LPLFDEYSTTYDETGEVPKFLGAVHAIDTSLELVVATTDVGALGKDDDNDKVLVDFDAGAGVTVEDECDVRLEPDRLPATTRN